MAIALHLNYNVSCFAINFISFTLFPFTNDEYANIPITDDEYANISITDDEYAIIWYPGILLISRIPRVGYVRTNCYFSYGQFT